MEVTEKAFGYYVRGGVFMEADSFTLKEGYEMWMLGPFQREDAAEMVRKALTLDWSHEDHARFFISHTKPLSYWVVGGRYKDTSFQTLESGEEERYGPYDDYEKAREVWRSKSLVQIDDCMVRYRLDKIGE